MTIIIQAPNGISIHQFFLGLIKRLQQLGHSVVAIGKGDSYFEPLKSHGVAIRDLHITEDSIDPISLGRYLWHIWKIYRTVRPDMVHLFSPRAALFGTLVASFLRIPVICTLTGLGQAFTLAPYHPIRIVFIMLYRFILPLAKAVIFLNPDDQSCFRRLRLIPQWKSVLIRSSGVNITRYRRGTKPYPQDEIVFTFVGRLMRSKGIYYFLRAAVIIAQSHTEARFLVVGDTDYGQRAMLSKEEIDWYRNKLESKINFVGHVADVRPLLIKSCVFVLPSYYREGVPQSILEAMALSLPIITTDGPGCRETVHDGVNGYLVRPHNVSDLVHSMKQFILNPQLILQMGAESRKAVVRDFSEQLVIEKTFRCYQKYIPHAVLGATSERPSI